MTTTDGQRRRISPVRPPGILPCVNLSSDRNRYHFALSIPCPSQSDAQGWNPAHRNRRLQHSNLISTLSKKGKTINSIINTYHVIRTLKSELTLYYTTLYIGLSKSIIVSVSDLCRLLYHLLYYIRYSRLSVVHMYIHLEGGST